MQKEVLIEYKKRNSQDKRPGYLRDIGYFR